MEGSHNSLLEDLDLLDDDLSFDDLEDADDNLVDHHSAAAGVGAAASYYCEDSLEIADHVYRHDNFQKIQPQQKQHQHQQQHQQQQHDISSDYILGTLIVRVIAARDMKPPKRGHLLNAPHNRRRIIFHRTPSFTFASVSFGNEIKRTSCTEETVNPTWTRSEQCLLFDVSLPLDQLAQSSSGKSSEDALAVVGPPLALLKIALFYSDHHGGKSLMDNNNNNKKKKKKKEVVVTHDEQQNHGDELMGVASLDVTSVITGKSSCIDKWLYLGGLEDVSGSVRVIVEYECAESHPRVGDKVRFHGFIESTLCPLPKSQVFRVEHVMANDEVILSFVTPVENWKCIIQVHRFMLISVERHVSAIERYQEELLNLTFNLANSPAADVVSETVRSLPEEGILFVGMQAAFGGLSLFERYREKGISTAVEDFVHVTNLDGKHTSSHSNYDDDMNEEGSSTEYDSIFSHDDISSLDRSNDVDLDGSGDDESLDSGMPCCPITGQPMRRPVVAADGNTYERSAIQRWLRSSDMSPLTGLKLKHKDLIPNYLLISSFQSWKRSTDDHHQISQI